MGFPRRIGGLHQGQKLEIRVVENPVGLSFARGFVGERPFGELRVGVGGHGFGFLSGRVWGRVRA